MLAIINIVAPVFGLMGLGFLAAKGRYLSEGAARIIAEFAFRVAMPALLFRAMLAIGDMPVSPWLLIATYVGALAILWTITSVLTLVVLDRPAIDAPAIAMGACFGNSVMLGVPLALTAFGPEAAAPVALLISLDSPVLWIIGTLHIEAARRAGTSTGTQPMAAMKGIVFDLLRNPIVVPLIAGTLFRSAGLGIPNMLDRLLEILGGAAVPAALFSLGMSLAAYRIKGQAPTLSLIIVMKMVVLPVIVFVLAAWVFVLPPVWTAIALLFAGLPVGANAFLFASRYERAVNSVSAAIAVSTAIAVVTTAIALYFLRSVVGMS